MLGIPSVCSARDTFQQAIRHGVDGFIAENDAEWLAALTALVESADLRRRMGEAARVNVLSRYCPDAVARRQVAPLVAGFDRRDRRKTRVLVVNVYFWPKSFGGATIVAEETARRLHDSPDTEVFLFTTQDDPRDPPHTLRRYIDTPSGRDMQVIGVRPPFNGGDAVLAFDNPQMQVAFEEVLRAVEPDVVHFHCVQALSASIMQSCQDRRIPYAVTVHDAWWLCQRQFMVNGDGRYCAQTKIDLRVCEACIPAALHLRQRMDILRQRLTGAEVLLFPSAFHRQLHLFNGIDPARAIVNRNGVRRPSKPRPQRAPGPLRFGYVGGNDRVKGIHLIKQAFSEMRRDDYELRLIDNTLNLGFRSMHVDDWNLSGTIKVLPAYTQETMDTFFYGIDVLLFPSQWKESFGLTVREALVRDVWVIATDGGGTVEDIVDGSNGTVIPLDGDARKLRQAIEVLLDDPAKLANHCNPYKDRITTYDAQADEIRSILAGIVKARVN